MSILDSFTRRQTVARETPCFFATLRQTQSREPIADNFTAIDIEWSPADAATIKLGAAHPGPDTFDNEGALQFGDRRYDHDDGASKRPIRIDRFALGQELDPQVIQFVQYLKEMFRAPGEPVA